MLLKIQEPHSIQSTEHPIALGIDLGTTHSLIAALVGDTVQVFDDHDGSILPSVVHYPKEVAPLVGHDALKLLEQEPKNTIRSAKRLLGKTLECVDQRRFTQKLTQKGNQIAYETNQGIKTPIEVSSEILKRLYLRAKTHITSPIEGVVIAVPAYFDEAQRVATKQAATLSNLNVLRLIHEPTAAAIAYGLEKKTSGKCLIFDLGGGTFDVTLLNMQEGIFQVKATGGDSALGGDDIDQLLLNHLLGDSYQAHAKWAAKSLKEALSETMESTFSYGEKVIKVSREQLNTWTKPFIDKLITITKNVLVDAKESPEAIDHIILVGGATRMPCLRQQVEAFFAKPTLCSIDPDQVVAIGAARHAASLIGNKHAQKSLLLDVTPLSLGLETMGGVVEKVIQRNTPIPAIAKERFTTYENNQTGMTFHIVQGERELVKDNRSLAQFTLKGLPPLPKGYAKVEVTFTLNEEGLLTVMAEELSTKTKTEVEINPSYGLNDDEITHLLHDAIEHADEDIQLKKLHTKRVEATQFFKAIEQALAEDVDTDRSDIKKALFLLQEAIEHASYDELCQAIANLEQHSDAFMRQRLDKTLKSMVHGKTLKEITENICQK